MCARKKTAFCHRAAQLWQRFNSTSASQFEYISSLFIHFCCTGPSSRWPVLPQAAAVRTRSHTVLLSYLCCEQHMLSFLYWHTYRLWGSSLNLLDHPSSNLVKDFSVFIPILFLQFWVLLVLKMPCEVFQSAKFLFVFSDQNILYVSVMCLYLYMLYCFTAALLGISPLEMSGTLWLTLLKLGDVTEGGRDQKWKNNR